MGQGVGLCALNAHEEDSESEGEGDAEKMAMRRKVGEETNV